RLPSITIFPYTTLFRSNCWSDSVQMSTCDHFTISNNICYNWSDDAIAPNIASAYGTITGNLCDSGGIIAPYGGPETIEIQDGSQDRKSTRLNSSHGSNS